MYSFACPSCNNKLDAKFRFCPHCGYDLTTPIVCPNCQYPNETNSKYCQECGTPLKNQTSDSKPRSIPQKPPVTTFTEEIEDPPGSGITIEFPYSSAQSFDFALNCAQRFSTFKQYGNDKKAIYRVTFQPADMDQATELVENLKGWRRRVVYVNGEKVTWESVFSFTYCYEKKKASFKPEIYCFGFENDWEFNIWGCIQAHLPFSDHAQWFCWGSWLNEKGDWEFDKERIRYELQKALYPFRYCPALQPELIQDAISALPDVVNPTKDRNWKFVERYGEEATPGLVIVTERYGFREKVVMKGVCPNGTGAFKELAKRMKHRLPQMKQ